MASPRGKFNVRQMRMACLQVDGGQVVPCVPVVRLLLRAAAEGLRRPREVALLQRAVAQRKPALRVQRVHAQRQLPVLRRLQRSQRASQEIAQQWLLLKACRARVIQQCLSALARANPSLWSAVYSTFSHSCGWCAAVRMNTVSGMTSPLSVCSGDPPNTSAAETAFVSPCPQQGSAGRGRCTPPRSSSRAARCGRGSAARGCCAAESAPRLSRSALCSAWGPLARTTAWGHPASPAGMWCLADAQGRALTRTLSQKQATWRTHNTHVRSGCLRVFCWHM